MSKHTSARILALSFAVLMLLSYAAPIRASGVPFNNGDVFIGKSTGDVLQVSPTGTLLDTLVPASPGYASTGMAFNSTGFLYVTGFGTEKVDVYNTTGSWVSTFGSGYNADLESIVFNKTGYVYVGQADGTRHIKLFSPTGTFIRDFAPATEDRGTDWIDLNPDQCTMYYTSEGHLVKQYNVCTDTQMPDFATGLNGSAAYAHRLLPDGTTLVADTQQVLRLNSTGGIMQVYGYNATGGFYFALNLDPDGKTFWTANIDTGDIYRFDIASGALVTHFIFPGETDGLVVKGEITGGTGFVIPEVPFGTILSVVIPLAALAVYTRRQAIHFK